MATWWEDLVDDVACPLLHDSRDDALACATDHVEAMVAGETVWVRHAIRVRFIDVDDARSVRVALWPAERTIQRQQR